MIIYRRQLFGCAWLRKLDASQEGSHGAINSENQSLVENSQVFGRALIVLVSIVKLLLHHHDVAIVDVRILRAKAELLGSFRLNLTQ